MYDREICQFLGTTKCSLASPANSPRATEQFHIDHREEREQGERERGRGGDASQGRPAFLVISAVQLLHSEQFMELIEALKS